MNATPADRELLIEAINEELNNLEESSRRSALEKTVAIGTRDFPGSS